MSQTARSAYRRGAEANFEAAQRAADGGRIRGAIGFLSEWVGRAVAVFAGPITAVIGAVAGFGTAATIATGFGTAILAIAFLLFFSQYIPFLG